MALAKQNQSTLALEAATATTTRRTTTATAPPLTRDQVRSVVLSAAIPMVGFGFMDNFIMITAGSAIDNTLGVQMGLATMTAAALGQVVSDVSGVLFGDTMARAFQVRPANLSEAQKKLASVARLRLGGAVGGVILGCCLGASALHLIPEEAGRETPEEALPPTAAAAVPLNGDLLRDRLDRIQKVVHDVLTSPEDSWHEKAATCTLYVRNVPEGCLPTAVAAPRTRSLPFFGTREPPKASVVGLNDDGNANANDSGDPRVRHALEEGRVVVFADTIYVPVRGGNNSNNDENVLGIVKIELGQGSFYTGSEIRDAKRLARNLGFFLDRVVAVR